MALTTKVAVDTNMLLAINEQNVDVFAQIKQTLGNVEFVVPNQVFEELINIEKKGKTAQKNVNIAKILMKKNKVKKVRVNAKNADSALLELSRDALIASNDKELKKAVKKNSGHVIYLRQGKFIEIH